MKTRGPEYVADMRDALSGFFRDFRRIDPGPGTQPIVGSIAAEEWRDFPRPALLVDAHNLAGMLIDYSADHIDALAKAISESSGSFPACTSVRSMLEPCALATWIATPSIGAHERAKRVYALRYDAIEEGKKFAKAVNPGAGPDLKSPERVETLERDAMRLGYQRVVDKHGKRIGIGCKKPEATKLVADMLGEEAKYRLLSAVAHGQHWALRHLGFEPTKSVGERLRFGGVPVSAFEKTLHVNVVADLGLCALRSFARPVTCMLSYGGHDSGPFDRLLETTFEFLRVPKAQRHSSAST